MKYFQKLNDSELNDQLKKYDKIIKDYERIIIEYDKSLKDFHQNKNKKDFNFENNPIVFSDDDRLMTKQTSKGTYYVKGIDYDHFIEDKETGLYLITKEGAKITFDEKSELFLRRKRQIELILRGRKKENEKANNVGFVYVLSNKSLPPNTFKIGSTYGIPEERAEELTGTGHLNPFKVETFIKIKSAEFYEKKIHSLLKAYRVKKNREFFEIELNEIKKILKDISVLSDRGDRKLSLSDLKKRLK